MRVRHSRGILRSGLLLVTLATAAFSQGERATISGTITDSTLAVVEGASITIRSVETNITMHGVSNSSGVFVFPALPPGRYDLTAEKQGFRAFKVAEIPLSVGLTATATGRSRKAAETATFNFGLRVLF
jgi:Carboxypeptidase regulatory-like domain